jgi:mRNA interferase RelE/StbE
MIYVIEITEEALAMLEEIPDRRVRRKILDRIKELAKEPEKQGKPLVDSLAGFRSFRAVGQRYRIVYEIHSKVVKVLVVGVGIWKDGHRTDVYARLSRFLRKKQGPRQRVWETGPGRPKALRTRSPMPASRSQGSLA